MILKIFKAVWFFSLLATLAVFMYIYASVPEFVELSSDGEVIISREGFFYTTLLVMSLFNVLVFIINRLFRKEMEHFVSWFYGLIICFNFFFIIVLGFLNLYNGDERFDFNRLGFLIYGSIGLVIAWVASWPILVLARKYFVQKEV
ncbi:MAG: hypothetical protein ACOYW3_04230 [Bacteroidota bacterium]